MNEIKPSEIKKRSWRQVVFWVIAVLTILLLAGGVWRDLTHHWTGYSNFTSPLTQEQLIERQKTIWDWLELLLIPFVLAGGGLWFSWAERRNEQAIAEGRANREREIAEDNAQEAALQAYLEQMSALLVDKRLRKSTEDDETRDVARAWTLTVARRLKSGERKGVLLRFLYESGLIMEANTIVHLTEVNLMGASLIRADLRGANLTSANLAGANLTGANLMGANLTSADLVEANLAGASLDKANLGEAFLARANLTRAGVYQANLTTAYLVGANLTGAYMLGTDLTAVHMWEANLTEAELVDAHLMYAHLRKTNLGKANLLRADLTSADLRGASLVDATLADANLTGANLTGVNLTGANLQMGNLSHAIYNKSTKWPEDFDAEKAGAVLVEEEDSYDGSAIVAGDQVITLRLDSTAKEIRAADLLARIRRGGGLE